MLHLPNRDAIWKKESARNQLSSPNLWIVFKGTRFGVPHLWEAIPGREPSRFTRSKRARIPARYGMSEKVPTQPLPPQAIRALG